MSRDLLTDVTELSDYRDLVEVLKTDTDSNSACRAGQRSPRSNVCCHRPTTNTYIYIDRHILLMTRVMSTV